MKKILILMLLTINLQAQTSFLHQLSYGKYSVGFQSFVEYDQARPAIKEQKIQGKGRLLQINVWYPAKAEGDTKMTFEEYVHLVGKELDADNADYQADGYKKYFAWPISTGTSPSDIDVFLKQNKPLYASQNSSFANGTFPLVLLMHGFATDYAFLGEYLASMGYIAVQVPVKGSQTYELDYGLNDKGLESQVLDYEYIINKISQKFNQAQVNQVGVVAFSFGGQSAIGLAIRNPQIKCVISLDGGIGSDFGGTLLSKQGFYDPTKIKAPILHLYNPKDAYTDLKWLSEYSLSNRYLVALNNVIHGHFTSFGLLDNQIPFILGKNEPRPSDAYETIMLYTQTFLDKCLKNKPHNIAKLQNQKWVKTCVQSFKTLKS
jgi:dienelactone hydrolase